MTTTDLREFAKLLTNFDQRLTGVERARTFANASMEDVGIPGYDIDGQLTTVVGKQFDNTYAAVSYAGPPPPRPTAPAYEVDVDKLFVTWDGHFADSIYTFAPSDWTRAEIHVGPAGSEGTMFNTLRDTIETPRGGTATVLGLPTDVDLYAWVVGRTQSGKYSVPSAKAGPFQLHRPADAAEALAAAQAANDTAQTAAEAADAAQQAALEAAGLAGDASTAAGTASGKADAAATAASTAAGKADAAKTAADTAAGKADSASTAAGTAAGLANDAIAAANKPKIIFTTSAPVGDTTVLWVPPPDNIPRKWNTATSQWDKIPDANVKLATDAAAAADKKAADAATAAQTAANAASTAQGRADAAMTTATGKNTVTYSANAAAASVPGIRAGDLWYQQIQVAGPRFGQIIGTWTWDGSAWKSAVFGDEVLGTLTAGKITAGTINAHVQIAGRFSTSSLTTGARREMNAVGFQAWDANNTMTINLDGVNNLLTGRYRTAISGRRIEMAAGGSLSQIDFWGETTNRTFIRAFTEADGKEAIQIGYGDPTQNGLDGRLNINSVGWFTSRFTRTDFVVGESWNLYGAAVDNGQNWMRYVAATKALTWNNIGAQQTYATGQEYREANDFWWKVRPAAGADVDMQFTHEGRFRVSYGADAYFGGWFELMQATQAYSTSPKLGLFTNDGYGGYMRFNGGPTWQDMEFKYYDDAFYVNLQARAYVVQSDAAAKESIVEATDVDCLHEIRKVKPKRYRRTAVDTKGNVFTGGMEIGLLAQEAPAQIVHDNGKVGELGIDMYQMSTMQWGAIQQLADSDDEVRALLADVVRRLDALDRGKKK